MCSETHIGPTTCSQSGTLIFADKSKSTAYVLDKAPAKRLRSWWRS